MTVSKSHFEQTARIIKNARESNSGQYDDPTAALNDPAFNKPYRDMAEFFAHEYKRDNPRFDRERFMRACGLTILN